MSHDCPAYPIKYHRAYFVAWRRGFELEADKKTALCSAAALGIHTPYAYVAAVPGLPRLRAHVRENLNSSPLLRGNFSRTQAGEARNRGYAYGAWCACTGFLKSVLVAECFWGGLQPHKPPLWIRPWYSRQLSCYTGIPSTKLSEIFFIHLVNV